MNKRWRIYFNRKEDYPCIWSVDEGSAASEIRVQGLVITDGLLAYSNNTPGLRPPAGADLKNEPSAWIEVNGVLTIENGVVSFGMRKDSE